jgi:hypothetical protein
MSKPHLSKYSLALLGVWLMLLSSSSCLAAFSSIFATADECAFCHTSSPSALIDGRGNDLSIADDWVSTMMANSFRDPFFRAKLESEISRTPGLADLIEDKCVTCHTPMARTQAVKDGARRYSLSEAETSALAWDGVSCTLCHQIADDLDDKQRFSGTYTISAERKIFGPYKQVFANPMLQHVNYLPVYGEQVNKPELCAVCHTLFTPYVDDDGKVVGEFPEQTPYLEWLNSSYASSDSYQSCQDCHMPRIDEPVKITNRPPWYQVRQAPFWKHHFTGGNIFVLEMMKENRERLGIAFAEEQFDRTIERTKNRLLNDSAEIVIERISNKNNRLLVDVKVTNKTGHKFPTGFPSRRAWIHLSVVDSRNSVVFESGKATEQGDIAGLDSPYEPHFSRIDSADQIQIYQAIMGDISGKKTDTLLKAAVYLKDNRLMPKGYRQAGPMAEYTRPAGEVVDDEDFNAGNNQEGSGADLVTYAIGLDDAQLPLTIQAQLLYQSGSPGFFANLLADDTPAVSRFKEMYSAARNIPVVVASSTFNWDK